MNGNKTTITIYTKYCAECMWPKEMMTIKNYVQHFGLELKIKRTTFRPELHTEASKLYGSEDYEAFVVVRKKVFTIMEFAESCKNKLVRKGKGKNGEPEKRAEESQEEAEKDQ